jgi:hypothetical protein
MLVPIAPAGVDGGVQLMGWGVGRVGNLSLWRACILGRLVYISLTNMSE